MPWGTCLIQNQAIFGRENLGRNSGTDISEYSKSLYTEPRSSKNGSPTIRKIIPEGMTWETLNLDVTQLTSSPGRANI